MLRTRARLCSLRLWAVLYGPRPISARPIFFSVRLGFLLSGFVFWVFSFCFLWEDFSGFLGFFRLLGCFLELFTNFKNCFHRMFLFIFLLILSFHISWILSMLICHLGSVYLGMKEGIKASKCEGLRVFEMFFHKETYFKVEVTKVLVLKFWSLIRFSPICVEKSTFGQVDTKSIIMTCVDCWVSFCDIILEQIYCTIIE
jgi:hypothetical protein